MKKLVIGIDIGGSNVRAVLWDGKDVLKEYKILTPKSDIDFKNKVRALSATLGFGRKIDGVGVAAAGIVSGTKIKKCPNISYLKNFDIRALGFNCEVKLDNDARAFLRAEILKSDFNKKVLGLTIGTGIGRAFSERRDVKKIKQFERPERWERKYKDLRELKEDARLAFFLGEHFSRLMTFYKPEVIIVGGGVMVRKNFFKMLKAELKMRKIKARVAEPRFGEYAGAIGAAMLIS